MSRRISPRRTRSRGLLWVLCALCGGFFLPACATQQKSAGRAPGGPLEKKLSEEPNDPSTNLKLGEQSEATGDLLRAEQYYLRAEALGRPEDEMLPRLLRVLVQAQRYDEALDRCKKRLDRRPDDRVTRYVEAALFIALDRPKEAERELQTLQRTRPDDAEAYLALGRLYRDSGDTRARPMFEHYLKLAPNGDSAAQVRFDLDAATGSPAPESQ